MSVNFGGGSRRKGKNPGLFAAVGLCIAAVALVAAATVINNRTDKGSADYMSDYTVPDTSSQWLGVEMGQSEITLGESGLQTIEPDQSAQTAELEYNVPELQPDDTAQPPEDSGSLTVDELVVSDEDEVITATAAVSYRMPLAGGVIKEYSGEDLVYSATMCDWRVHQGVDIGGEIDCEVYAAADGVVVDFVEDMLYGYTAIIRQEDESMLYYCGLSSVPMVTSGLVVHTGDVIGKLGIVPCEAADPPHLHIAMMKDGTFTDPLKAMGL